MVRSYGDWFRDLVGAARAHCGSSTCNRIVATKTRRAVRVVSSSVVTASRRSSSVAPGSLLSAAAWRLEADGGADNDARDNGGRLLAKRRTQTRRSDDAYSAAASGARGRRAR